MKTVCFFITALFGFLAWDAESVSATGVICINDSTDIEIKGNLTAVIKIYKDFEILSEEGAAYSELAVPVNDYIEFSDLKGYTELRDGKRIKINEKDYMTLTGRMDREFGGKKAVLVSLKSPSVGARLHYQYRLDIKSLLYLPRVVRQNSYPVERMAVKIRWPSDLKINLDYSGFDKITDGRSALLSADDLPEIHAETNSCNDNLYLYLSADRFKFDGREYDSLTKIRELANRLLANSTSLTDSLKMLFDFVADSVSYVALRIGSGDFTPHNCGEIIERGFGDCKDQSLLLSSLFRVAGMAAYPVLISTSDYPPLELLHPWPAFFDHTLVKVHAGGNDLLLDPSDPLSDIVQIPPRLRGKMYLVVDGSSDLKTVPQGPEPDEGIYWSFDVEGESQKTETDFVISYINDAALGYGDRYVDPNGARTSGMVESTLEKSGWKFSSLSIEAENQSPDTFEIEGVFYADHSMSDSLTGFPVGSPLISYLIENIFGSVRQNPFCRNESLHLEEYVRLRNTVSYSLDLSEYRDYWVREGLEFYDEMKYIEDDIIFRRVCDLDGREISSEDFNAFRDFLLSRKNQRYVYLPY
jgi:hypothetical protein